MCVWFPCSYRRGIGFGSINVCFLIFVLSNKGEESLGRNMTMRKNDSVLWEGKHRPELVGFIVSGVTINEEPVHRLLPFVNQSFGFSVGKEVPPLVLSIASGSSTLLSSEL